MRHNTLPSRALGRQLAEWRRPLDSDPAVDEAVTRMLRLLDRTPVGERRDHDADPGFNRAAAD